MSLLNQIGAAMPQKTHCPRCGGAIRRDKVRDTQFSFLPAHLAASVHSPFI